MEEAGKRKEELGAIKSIRTEPPLKKVSFPACKPSHCSPSFGVCKCLSALAARGRGGAPRELPPAPFKFLHLPSPHGSIPHIQGAVNPGGEVPLCRQSESPSAKEISPRGRREWQHYLHQLGSSGKRLNLL